MKSWTEILFMIVPLVMMFGIAVTGVIEMIDYLKDEDPYVLKIALGSILGAFLFFLYLVLFVFDDSKNKNSSN